MCPRVLYGIAVRAASPCDLFISAPKQPGNSGGPVLTAGGALDRGAISPMSNPVIHLLWWFLIAVAICQGP